MSDKEEEHLVDEATYSIEAQPRPAPQPVAGPRDTHQGTLKKG